MTKYEMANAIAEKTGIKKQVAKKVVQLILDGIINVIETERRCELRDFGVFEVRMLKARKCRNPQTGADLLIPSRAKVYFRAGLGMGTKVNGCRSTSESAKALPGIS